MHQFEYFSRFAAFWFWNDDEELPPGQEMRHSTWFSGFRKEAQRLSGLARFADEA